LREGIYFSLFLFFLNHVTGDRFEVRFFFLFFLPTPQDVVPTPPFFSFLTSFPVVFFLIFIFRFSNTVLLFPLRSWWYPPFSPPTQKAPPQPFRFPPPFSPLLSTPHLPAGALYKSRLPCRFMLFVMVFFSQTRDPLPQFFALTPPGVFSKLQHVSVFSFRLRTTPAVVLPSPPFLVTDFLTPWRTKNVPRHPLFFFFPLGLIHPL